MRRDRCYVLILAIFLSMKGFSQQVGINEDGSLPNPSAILDVKSNKKGVLIPRMSTADRQNIPHVKGLLVYDTTTSTFWYNTGTVWKNLVSGATSGNAWLLTGNDSTDESNFLGTTNNRPLRIKVNNNTAGLIDPVYGTTYLGYRSMENNGQTYSNTAVGMYTLLKNVNGAYNTAVGGGSMIFNISGSYNAGFGLNTLANNTTGYYNTATGNNALFANTIGYYNTASGIFALSKNDVGIENTAFGSYALKTNTTGRSNTAVGASSMSGVLYGSYNTAVGYQAMKSASNGTLNTAIGTFADVLGQNTINSTAVGFGAVCNTSHKVRIGHAAVTSIEGSVPFTTPSDGRFKFEVKEDVKGLGFILQLRPVTYLFDVRHFDELNRGGQKDSLLQTPAMQEAYSKASSIRRTGFIAQEVETAAQKAGFEFSGLLKPKDEKDYYSISYESFVVPLVKAVQELNQRMELLEKENAMLRKQVTEIKR